MAEDNHEERAQLIRQKARKWYFWLWLSPLLTIPTLMLLLAAYDEYIYDLVCPHVWQDCNYVIAYRLQGLFAVDFSALWHLVLLIPMRDKESSFVRWHGRQEMLIAGLRTAVPLAFIVVFNSELPALLSILLLLPIWFFGTLWGQRQAARGDCSLARWSGRTNILPGPPPKVEADHVVEQSNQELVDIVRFSCDPEKRQAALDQLSERGLVENL
jgi:hypothetical protein